MDRARHVEWEEISGQSPKVSASFPPFHFRLGPWRTEMGKQVYKTDYDTSNFSNYRPISISLYLTYLK